MQHRGYRGNRRQQQQAPNQGQDPSFWDSILSTESIHLPPGSLFTLSLLGLITGILANIWQTFTSFTAFEHMILDGLVYRALGAAGQVAAFPIVTIICILISVSFQLAILYLVFRVERSWKERKVYGRGMDAIKGMAVEVAHQVPLILIWGALGFIADTVGDYTFLTLYTDNPFILFMYGTALYASSTIMLAAALEYYWVGRLAWSKWTAFQQALAAEAERLTRQRTSGTPKRGR